MSEIISLPDWKKRYYAESEHTIKRCEGCDAAILTGDKFCSGCGADQSDLFGRILAVDLDSVAPLAGASGNRWSDDAARDIRAVLKREGFKRISVRVGRGTARGIVDVTLPRTHDWKECDDLRTDRRCGYEQPACAACARRHAAGRHLEKIIHRALRHLDDRSDTMTDYFDFVFHVS